MTLPREIYLEIVNHLCDLASIRDLAKCDKMLNSFCTQIVSRHPNLRVLARKFQESIDSYQQNMKEFFSWGTSQDCKIKNETDYFSHLTELYTKRKSDKDLYFSLPVSKSIKFMISLWFIYKNLFIRIPPIYILRKYLAETKVFNNEYVVLFKHKTHPMDDI